MLTKMLSCSVCGSTEIEEVISLPSMPLTGLYYPNIDKALESPTFDQGLTLCTNCGHCQLTNCVDNSILYDNSYTHRTSVSPLSTKGNDFLYSYIVRSVPKADLLTVLEAGCNDCYLLKKLKQYSPDSDLHGFDPIWINNQPSFNGLNVFGSFVEDINKTLPDISPSLIVSAHTFEHVVNIQASLAILVAFAKEGARIIIEMPSFDTLLRLNRFDQVFHQHVQYISESSIHELVRQLNCRLNAITYNYTYWGGTVIFDFSKIKSSGIIEDKPMHTKGQILSSFESFKLGISAVGKSLPTNPDVSLLGAAQMLPILYYHSKDYIKYERILDDNPARINRFLPNTPLPVKSLSDFTSSSSSSSSFIIGAVDSSRALISRSIKLGFPNVFTFFNSCI